MDPFCVDTHTSLGAAQTAVDGAGTLYSSPPTRSQDEVLRVLDCLRLQWMDTSFALVLSNAFSPLPGIRTADLLWLAISNLVALATPASTVARLECKWQYKTAGIGKRLLRDALHARTLGLDNGNEPLLQAVAVATHCPAAGVAWHLDDEEEPPTGDDREFVRLSTQVFMRDLAVRFDPFVQSPMIEQKFALDHHGLLPCFLLDKPASACPSWLNSVVSDWLLGQVDFTPPACLTKATARLFYALALPVGALAAARRAGITEQNFRVLFELSTKDPDIIAAYTATCTGKLADALEGKFVGLASAPDPRHLLRAERLWRSAVALALFDYIAANQKQDMAHPWLQSYVMLDYARTEPKSRTRLATHIYLGRPSRPIIVVVLSRWFVYRQVESEREWISCQDAIHALGVWLQLLKSHHQSELECGYDFKNSEALSALLREADPRRVLEGGGDLPPSRK
jgi:hypothetical protein